MVGRLRSSFRSGDIAEHLGTLLLRGIAAVAEVPRTEDVGVDAVATLLRRDEDGNCYAEDTFLVQLKSSAERSVEYRGHGLDWFLAQTQPMFIGQVSLKESSISLYPTLHANQAAFALHAEAVTIKLDASERAYPWEGKPEKNEATVWLGKPLLTWSTAELGDPTWSSSAYDILKRFLELARREHELLSFGQCSKLTWDTNDKDSISSSFSMMKGHPGDLQSLGEKCTPCLNALFLHASVMPEDLGRSLMASLIALVCSLRKTGVDIDPNNLFAKVFVGLRVQDANNHGTGSDGSG